MKNTLYILLITGLFLSCKSNTKQSVKDSTSTIKPGVDQTHDLIQKFKPIIQGVWVKKDYIDKVIRTKSPLAADDEASGITTMYINTENIKGDSLIVEVGWGNHEGGELKFKFKTGKIASTIIVNDYDDNYELGYSIGKADTTLIMHALNKKTKKPVTTKYIKAVNNEPADNLGYGMNYLINKGLISGRYSVTDSLGNRSNIEFANNGKVIGLANFKTYFISDDLGGEPMNNLDEIVFDFLGNNNTGYSFKINADTLSLYDTHPNADSTLSIIGKRIYKLVKQK